MFCRVGAPVRPGGSPPIVTGRPARALNLGSICAPAVGETMLPPSAKGSAERGLDDAAGRVGDLARARILEVEVEPVVAPDMDHVRLGLAGDLAALGGTAALPLDVVAWKRRRRTMFTTRWSAV